MFDIDSLDEGSLKCEILRLSIDIVSCVELSGTALAVELTGYADDLVILAHKVLELEDV